MLNFIGLTLISLLEIRIRLAGWDGDGTRLVVLLQCLSGIGLIYRACALSVNLALGYKRST